MKTARHTALILLLGLWIVVPATTRAADSPIPRGFSIPLIDLDQQTQRQVVVDREKGQYLGHVTTVLLEDGKTIIAVYPKGHGRGAIVMKRSTDGGLTWSERLPTPESWATSREVPTLYRVVDAKGKKRLIMFSGLYPVRMAVSEDDGATWSELKPIGNFGGVVAMASCVKLRDGGGRYMTLFHDDGRFLRGGPDEVYGSPYTKHKGPPKFIVYKSLSTDGGLTWSDPEPIATHPTAHLCEPGAVRSPDGKQIAVLLRENSRKHNGFVIFSNDEGKTWTPPRELSGALTGDRHTAKYAPDGRLVIAFRDMCHESATKGDFVAWVGTYDDIVQGREGQYRLRLKDNKKGADTTYPGVEVLPDGTFVVTTYGHWVEGEMPYILSVRFKLAEIDAMAKRAAADPALHPVVINHAPGPEYADGTRIFQGIPGIERAKN
ncbi:MAG: exo-alpha-sialidase, partial [Verrucomicrobia bacterium]|nr:exo-alpha-sialidase [Verrucomicrobiota bacterium]